MAEPVKVEIDIASRSTTDEGRSRRMGTPEQTKRDKELWEQVQKRLAAHFSPQGKRGSTESLKTKKPDDKLDTSKDEAEKTGKAVRKGLLEAFDAFRRKVMGQRDPILLESAQPPTGKTSFRRNFRAEFFNSELPGINVFSPKEGGKETGDKKSAGGSKLTRPPEPRGRRRKRLNRLRDWMEGYDPEGSKKGFLGDLMGSIKSGGKKSSDEGDGGFNLPQLPFPPRGGGNARFLIYGINAVTRFGGQVAKLHPKLLALVAGIGVVTGGVILAGTAAKLFANQVEDARKNLMELSQELAIASALRQQANIEARLRQAGVVGDELARIEMIRTRRDEAMISIQTKLLDAFLPVQGLLEEILTSLLEMAEPLIELLNDESFKRAIKIQTDMFRRGADFYTGALEGIVELVNVARRLLGLMDKDDPDVSKLEQELAAFFGVPVDDLEKKANKGLLPRGPLIK